MLLADTIPSDNGTSKSEGQSVIDLHRGLQFLCSFKCNTNTLIQDTTNIFV